MEVCIIGAGQSGINAAKICLDHGLVPYVLSKSPQAGGIWNGFENEVGVWNSLRTNISKYNSSYSDYLWNPDDPDYPTTQQVRDYMQGYIQKHSLDQYFHFNSTVLELSRLGEDYNVKWTVGGEIKEQVFRYVIVASGNYSKPYNPMSNSEVFHGTVVHGGYYREPSIFTGKKVVVVGRSFTSNEITCEAFTTAAHVTQLYTKNCVLLKRHLIGLPGDFFFNSHMALSSPTHIIQDLESTTEFINLIISLAGNPSQILPEWEIPQEPTRLYRVSTITDEYCEAVSSRKIAVVKGKAKEFYSDGIILEDGSQLEADVVILGTGYCSDYLYFSEEIKSILQYDPNDPFLSLVLFRGILHPSLPRLFFAGTFLGGHSGRYELPNEIGIRQMLGKLHINEEELWQGVRDEEYIRIHARGVGIPYTFADYLKELLRILGIKIDMEFIKNELEFSKGPLLPQMLWLERPGQIDLAKTAIAEIKAKYPHFEFN